MATHEKDAFLFCPHEKQTLRKLRHERETRPLATHSLIDTKRTCGPKPCPSVSLGIPTRIRTLNESVENFCDFQFHHRDIKNVENLSDFYRSPICHRSQESRFPRIRSFLETSLMHQLRIPGRDTGDRTLKVGVRIPYDTSFIMSLCYSMIKFPMTIRTQQHQIVKRIHFCQCSRKIKLLY